ncbi:MAG: acyl-CoA desaturase [Bacteroidia bacterium]|nr:acyl-CoA desaturase [Bacteroidia bacterium]
MKTSSAYRFDLLSAAWFYLMLIPTLAFIWQAVTLNNLLVSLLLFWLTVCLGHSVGLHRGLIHRSYTTSRLFRNILLYLFVHSGLGNILSWTRSHHMRDYWQNQPECPPWFGYDHSMLRDYWWNLHTRYTDADMEKYRMPDHGSDPFIRHLARYGRLHVLAACGLIGYLWGWQTMLVLYPARISATILGHWFVGYMTHTRGEKRYHIRGASVQGTNQWLLGLISFGEGYHNNHHAFPASARMGIRLYEIDLGWYALWSFRACGLVRDLKSATEETLKPSAVKCEGFIPGSGSRIL